MNLSKKLNAWHNAGLIDLTTVGKINQYEQDKSKPIVLWAIASLGAFSIVIGLISVVAANWLFIPDALKLSTDLFICFVISLILYKTFLSSKNNSASLWKVDVMVIIYYGFTLASMALIGQTYQQGGSIATLFLVWSIVTIPLVLLGRGQFLAGLWFFGSATTYILNVESIYGDIRLLTASKFIATSISVSAYLLGPLFFILVSRVPCLVKLRPMLANEFSRFSWVAILVFGMLCQFLWYEVFVYDFQSEALCIVGICFIATFITVSFIPRLYPEDPSTTHLAMRVVLTTVFILGASALWHSEKLALIGALSNIVYLCILAWAALIIRSSALFNTITALICIRILAIYFEVFGSMLETGIGLVLGGSLTLAVAMLWFKKSDALALKFGLKRRHRHEK